MVAALEEDHLVEDHLVEDHLEEDHQEAALLHLLLMQSRSLL